jgi:hypothetical protein
MSFEMNRRKGIRIAESLLLAENSGDKANGQIVEGVSHD